MNKIIFLFAYLLLSSVPNNCNLSPVISWSLSVLFIAKFLAPTMVSSTDRYSIIIKRFHVTSIEPNLVRFINLSQIADLMWERICRQTHVFSISTSMFLTTFDCFQTIFGFYLKKKGNKSHFIPVCVNSQPKNF